MADIFNKDNLKNACGFVGNTSVLAVGSLALFGEGGPNTLAAVSVASLLGFRLSKNVSTAELFCAGFLAASTLVYIEDYGPK